MQAGPGITVTGDGSPANPYRVTQAGVAGLTVADTSTVDLAVSGSGTGVDPFVVSGSTKTDGVLDAVGGRLEDPLQYNAGPRTIGVAVSAAGGNAVEVLADGLFVVDTTPMLESTPAYALATVTADSGGGDWEIEIGGATSTARPGPGYTPAVGHTDVIALPPATGMFGAGSTDPTFYLMLGRLP